MSTIFFTEPDSISTVILPGKWPKKLTGSHFDWSSQSAKAKAKERGNPNHKHSRFRWRAFSALNEGKPSDAISSLCSQRMSHDDDFDPDDNKL